MIVSNDRKRYHRVATVRKLEGMSAPRAAARLGVPVSHISRLEDEYIDLPVSLMYAWQKALDVPLSELLIGSKDATPEGIWDRAKLLKAMKTVGSILEVTEEPMVERMANNLRNELVQIMPELADVKPWPRAGTPRKPHECFGRILEQTYVDLQANTE